MTAHSVNETARHADLVLPGVTYAEKFGTMINVTGRIQRLNRAIQPVGYAGMTGRFSGTSPFCWAATPR